MRPVFVAVGLILVAGPAAAQGAQSGTDPHAIVALPDKIAWGPVPAILPRGAELAVVEGDPTKAGPFTMRLRMPDGYRIPPHFHPVIEHVTVIKGTFRVGMGEKFDAAKLADLPTGTFAALAPGVRHFAEPRVRRSSSCTASGLGASPMSTQRTTHGSRHGSPEREPPPTPLAESEQGERLPGAE